MNLNGMTYEEKDTNTVLEEYEWSNTWHEKAPDSKKPRVLYIGDSISLMTRVCMNRVEGAPAYVDGIHTSKALDNPTFIDFVRLFASEEGERELLLFNNGLHGWHLSEEKYEAAYESFVLALRAQIPAKELFLILTTRTSDEGRHARVIARNAAVRRIAEKHGFPVIDLYTVSCEHFDKIAPDGVHFTEAGYTVFAKHIWENLKDYF